jgi:hypothetical protein
LSAIATVPRRDRRGEEEKAWLGGSASEGEAPRRSPTSGDASDALQRHGASVPRNVDPIFEGLAPRLSRRKHEDRTRPEADLVFAWRHRTNNLRPRALPAAVARCCDGGLPESFRTWARWSLPDLTPLAVSTSADALARMLSGSSKTSISVESVATSDWRPRSWSGLASRDSREERAETRALAHPRQCGRRSPCRCCASIRKLAQGQAW